VERMGSEYIVLIRKSEGKIPLKSLRRMYVNNIKIDLREVEC
jgi:hypothetical protein